jgi:hypothetical protein
MSEHEGRDVSSVIEIFKQLRGFSPRTIIKVPIFCTLEHFLLFHSFIPLNRTSKKAGAKNSFTGFQRRATPTVYTGFSGVLLRLSSTMTEYLGHVFVG